MIPNKVSCPKCRIEIELESKEREEGRFICPACGVRNDLNSKVLDESSSGSEAECKKNFRQIFFTSLFTPDHPAQKKFVFTLLGLLIYQVGKHIYVPGIDIKLLVDAGHISLAASSIFSLGIMPYLSAATIVLLLSGFIPYLKRLRDGSEKQNQLFDFIIYFATFIIAGMQAYGSSQFLESIQFQNGELLVSMGSSFSLVYTITVSSGTMFLVWLAQQITKKGIANGVAIFILIQVLTGGLDSFYIQDKGLAEGYTVFNQIIFILFSAIIILGASIYLTQAKREIATKRYNELNDNWDDSNVTIPIRVNTVGIIPVYIASSIMFIPQTIITLLPESITTLWIQDSFNMDNPFYWVAYGVMVFFLTYLFTAITFSTKDLVSRVKRYNYKISEIDSNQNEKKYIDKLLEKTILPGAIFIVLVSIFPVIIDKFTTIKLGTLVGPGLLIVSAVGIDIYNSICRDLKYFGQREKNGNIKNRISVFKAETLLDCEIIKDILHNDGIESIVYSNRVIPSTGTLAIWEVCRPTYPAFTIYRGLGQGQVQVLVSEQDFDNANEIIIKRVSDGEYPGA